MQTTRLAFVTALWCAAGACAAPGPDRGTPPGPQPPAAPLPAPAPPAPPPAPPAPALPAPPWSGPSLAASAVPAHYLAEWAKAENRATCAPLAPTSLGEGAAATPRAAYFGGGWAVAYDLPNLRSAFGIAGTGSLAADRSYDDWPFRRRWVDGSNAGYGPEGGTGPNLLAYLRVTGQGCLYNVWSRLGRTHLEHLLDSLRYVAR